MPERSSQHKKINVNMKVIQQNISHFAREQRSKQRCGQSYVDVAACEACSVFASQVYVYKRDSMYSYVCVCETVIDHWVRY